MLTINSSNDLKGIFTALFTPLKKDDPKNLYNSIDYDKAKLMIDDLIDIGVSGIVPMGTTGQSATVSTEQHIEFVKFTVNYVNKRVPIIAGAGSNSTRESIETIKKIKEIVGNLTFLCVTGYYNTPPQAGIIENFNTIVNETGSNIIIYNVPSRTNNYIDANSLIELSKNPNIIGLKQAANFKDPGEIQQDTLKVITESNNFSVFSGEDDSLYDMLSMGGTGMISATANIPEATILFLKIIEAMQQGNTEEAELLQKQVNKYAQICFIQKNPIPLASLFRSAVYLPLVSIDQIPGSEAIQQQISDFVIKTAPSLKKYW